jgi:hypothetical protein
MGKFVRLGIGILAGAAAGVAIYAFFRKREIMPVYRQSYAEAAEASEEAAEVSEI